VLQQGPPGLKGAFVFHACLFWNLKGWVPQVTRLGVDYATVPLEYHWSGG